MQAAPVIKDLILLGGGHSHIAVLKRFGMRPIPGVRLTLISRDIETAYSGMLPGLIAGHYSFDQAHIDLAPLARFAGARFLHAEVTGIDPRARTVMLANRPPIRYDVLSINTGSTPSVHDVGGADRHVVPVKPINRFLERWNRLRERLGEYGAGVRIGVVGGGAGGVELSLAIHHALTTQQRPPEAFKLELLTADEDILREHPRRVARRLRRILAARDIEVHAHARVVRVDQIAETDQATETAPMAPMTRTDQAERAPPVVRTTQADRVAQTVHPDQADQVARTTRAARADRAPPAAQAARTAQAAGVAGVAQAARTAQAAGVAGVAQAAGSEPKRLIDAAGREFRFHEVLWVTQAGPPPWLAASGLRVDAQGFMLVNDRLQSLSHGNVFGAGDVAAMAGHPRPKAGVFAVRQGRPLARNLRRYLLQGKLVRHRPQRQFLKLIGAGGRYAVASRGPWSAEGRWVWRWKDRIDTRFMAQYQRLPAMPTGPATPPARPRRTFRAAVPAPLREAAALAGADDAMRCGGCGAKVGADVLAAALADLPTAPRDDVVVGLDAPDDAALLAVPAARLAVLSVDGFRSMIDDPYLFGGITATHCLGDIHAMGAQPQAAMTMATLPVWPEEKLVDELRQMLLGALAVFEREGAALVGGHTGEGAELTLGFAVTGLVQPDRALRKAALRAGDRLVLTKPLGTGTLLAAHMRAQARGAWLDAAVGSMRLSCRTAGEILGRHGARACTDVTGFGLAGHLLEMLGPSAQPDLGARLDLDALPVLPGAIETLAAGIASTLQPKNERFAAHVEAAAELRAQGEYALLFDPQTAGGLLAGVPPENVAACAAELEAHGYPDTAVIGEVVVADARAARIRVVRG